jgi:hypothetical protein
MLAIAHLRRSSHAVTRLLRAQRQKLAGLLSRAWVMVNVFRSMRSLTSELMPDRPAGRRAGQPHDPRTLSELSSTSSSPSLAQLDAFVDRRSLDVRLARGASRIGHSWRRRAPRERPHRKSDSWGETRRHHWPRKPHPCARRDERPLPRSAEKLENRRMVEGGGKAKWLAALLGIRDPVAGPSQCLIGMTKKPEGEGTLHVSRDHWVV